MKKSYVIAGVLTLGLTAWVVGGYVLKSPDTGSADTAQNAKTAEMMAVAVRTQVAKPVQQFVLAQGQAVANRTVLVRAETSGQVAEILKDEGTKVAAGDLIARLKPNDRQARVDRAMARVKEQERAFEASQALGRKGYQTQRQSDETYSALQTAKAELEEAQIEMAHTEIRAPFEGEIVTSEIEIGAYVAVNGEVATIVDNDPLVVRVSIAQKDISNIELGKSASVSFATGEERNGTVSYVSARADDDTRTFRVEIEIANPDYKIRSGVSAEANIPTGEMRAHFVSPATLSLNDEGVLGIKTVDTDEKVHFHRASIVRSGIDGVWVAGLPNRSRIITVGQGFVRVGDKVKVSEEGDSKESDSPPPTAAFLSGAHQVASGERK